MKTIPSDPALEPEERSRTGLHRENVQRRQAALAETLHGLVTPSVAPVWEVGCGHGHFLTAFANAHPEHFCIGVDIVRDRIERANRKANRAKLPNLRFVLAEAQEFLALLPEDVKFSSVFVLFPDPWPKRRHHKNRIMQTAFLDSIAERAGEGTRIYFRTDFEPYFAEVSAVIAAHPRWARVDEPWPFEVETVFQARAANYFSLVAGYPPPKT